MNSYCCIACTRPARSGGISSSCRRRSSATSSIELLAPLVARARGLVDPAVDPLALHVDDLVELFGDVVVDAAEVAALELLPAPLAQPLEHLAQAHELLAVAVLEPLLHHPAQGRVEVAVVQEVVGHLVEQRLGVEVEAGLRPVPAGVPESGPFAATESA